MDHYKTIGAEIGGLFGMVSTIVIDWEHIAERGVETAIIAFINGGLGAIGGVIFLWLAKRLYEKFIASKRKKNETH